MSLLQPIKSWPRNTVKAIRYAGPSHQSVEARRKEMAVISIVGPK
jgi:hypothetical protein